MHKVILPQYISPSVLSTQKIKIGIFNTLQVTA